MQESTYFIQFSSAENFEAAMSLSADSVRWCLHVYCCFWFCRGEGGHLFAYNTVFKNLPAVDSSMQETYQLLTFDK